MFLFYVSMWGFPKMVVPNNHWVFLLKLIILVCEMGGFSHHLRNFPMSQLRDTLQGTNISPQNWHFESMMIFLFPRWDMWISWRVDLQTQRDKCGFPWGQNDPATRCVYNAAPPKCWVVGDLRAPSHQMASWREKWFRLGEKNTVYRDPGSPNPENGHGS